MERRRFPSFADQSVAHDVSPRGARRRRRTPLVHLWGDAVPGDAIKVPVPPAVLRGDIGKLAAAVVWRLGHGCTTTFKASFASRTNRYPSAAPSRGDRCVIRC